MPIATITQAIARGKLSIGYAANNNARGSLFGKRLASNPPISPVTIAMVTDALEWGVDAQTDEDQREVCNYLIWLIGLYGMQAQARLGDTSGGGSLTPGGGDGSNNLNVLDWFVDVTATPIAPLADGESSVLLDGTSGNEDYRTFNIEFARGNLTQTTTNFGQSYYSWNKNTGLFTCFPAASFGESFRITPV